MGMMKKGILAYALSRLFGGRRRSRFGGGLLHRLQHVFSGFGGRRSRRYLTSR